MPMPRPSFVCASCGIRYFLGAPLRDNEAPGEIHLSLETLVALRRVAEEFDSASRREGRVYPANVFLDYLQGSLVEPVVRATQDASTYERRIPVREEAA